MLAPALDYEAHFYVVDRILQFAEPSVLFIFRCTSKLYKSRVDKLLEHLVVDMVVPPRKSNNSKKPAAPFRNVRIVSMAGWVPPPFRRADLSRLAEDKAQQMIKFDRARIEPVLRCAKVLELNGALSYNLPTLARGGGRAFPPPPALRVTSPSGSYTPKIKHLRVISDHLGRFPPIERIEAETVVIFAGAADAGPGEQCSPLNPVEPSAMVSKIVINIPYHDSGFYREYGHADLRLPRHAQCLEEVVFIFHEVDESGRAVRRLAPQDALNAPTRLPPGDSDMLFQYENDVGWISLHESLSEIFRGARPKLTYVGLPPHLRMGMTLVSPRIALAAHLAFIAEEQCMWGFVNSRVTTVSHQAYRSRTDVNPDLEMRCSQWPARLCRSIKDNPRYEPHPMFGGLPF